jgi:thiamine-phosphate pyrophosphorylase
LKPELGTRNSEEKEEASLDSSSTPRTEFSLPNFFITGRSTHSLAQARAALEEGFDYIGFGPLFPTPTKVGRPAIGLQDIATMEREIGSKIPAFCIGGITRKTLPQVLAAGARRVVIVSDLLQADNVEAATAMVITTLGLSIQ